MYQYRKNEWTKMGHVYSCINTCINITLIIKKNGWELRIKNWKLKDKDWVKNEKNSNKIK